MIIRTVNPERVSDPPDAGSTSQTVEKTHRAVSCRRKTIFSNNLHLATVNLCLYSAAVIPPPISYRLVGLVVKASASRAEDPVFDSRLRRDFLGVESYQWLKNWYSSGYPARRLAL